MIAVISSGFGSGFDWLLFHTHVLDARWVNCILLRNLCLLVAYV